MTTTTTTTVTTVAKTKRHPIRGFLYGIPFGLGVAMIAIGQKWAALGTWPPFILFIVGILVSMAWSTLGPAKAPKDQPPVGLPADSADSDVVPAADAVTVTETVTEPATDNPETSDPETSDPDKSTEDGLTEGDETG